MVRIQFLPPLAFRGQPGQNLPITKHFHPVLAGLIIALLLGVIWLVLSGPHEPVYQRRPLSNWLDQYGTNHWSARHGDLEHEAETAIRQIGAKAVPTLLNMMSARESPFKTNILGHVPKSWLVRLHLPSVADYHHQLGERRRHGAFGFVALGPDARPFIPALVRLLDDTNADVRYVSVFALRSLGPVAKESLPSLIKCLDDPEFTVRDDAVMGLGTIHEDPERVIPILRNFIGKNRGNPILCQDAMAALGRFGTLAESAAPDILPLLNNQNSFTRSEATNALKAIAPEAAAKAGVK